MIDDRSRDDGPRDGGPIVLLAVIAALALVGSIGWALAFGI